MTRRRTARRFAWLLTIVFVTPVAAAAEPHWPPLPEQDGAAEIPAQEWPLRPGPRTVRVQVHYPGGRSPASAPAPARCSRCTTGAAPDCVGTADPRELAAKLDVVALCVNYLQSGKADSIDGPEPYDFGYLQALDALRALHWFPTASRGAERRSRRAARTAPAGPAAGTSRSWRTSSPRGRSPASSICAG